MQTNLARIPLVAHTLWLSMILTLYMAPSETKYTIADLASVLLLLVWLFFIQKQWFCIVDGLKPLTPIAILLVYAVVISPTTLGDLITSIYIQQLLVGFVPFMVFYVVFRHQPAKQERLLAVAVFVLPGLIHLVYMYVDIFLALQHGEVTLTSSSRQGILEYIKDVPRVGRRYVSVALLHFSTGGLLLAVLYRQAAIKLGAWSIVSISILSLALLDARAAYASLLMGGILLVSFIDLTYIKVAVSKITKGLLKPKLMLIIIALLVLIVGYNAGKSRWLAMSYSIQAATHDVLDTNINLPSRPYIDKNFWIAPIDNVPACIQEGQFRCLADQSAYLRIAWLITGLQSLVHHPFGIGYSENYLGKLWAVSGDESKYQHSDSFLIEQIVSFGLVGILLYASLWWKVGSTLQQAIKQKHEASLVLIIMVGIIFICVGRSLVDTFSEGLWRYLMALLGMYYGLLHSNAASNRIK